MAKTVLRLAETSGAKAQNADWLSPDLGVDRGDGKIRVALAVTTNSIIEVTLDGGTIWVKLNEGKALVADSYYGFDVMVRTADQFNMRTPDAAGTSVHFARYDFLNTEG